MEAAIHLKLAQCSSRSRRPASRKFPIARPACSTFMVLILELLLHR